MPTSAAGSNPLRCVHGRCPAKAGRFARGFTLIELMVVVALIAVATAGAVLSLRDSTSAALERDAQRLAAVLEAARAQARASDVPVIWQAQANGFVLRGLARSQEPQAWLSADTRARTTTPLVLGPEPLMPPQQIELYSASQPQQRIWVVTDGLRPFGVQTVIDKGRP